MNYKNQILRKFCTPPFMELTAFDLKAMSSAEKYCIPFEGIELPVYSWGSGKRVLLAHGWGSRASHLSLIARTLAADGFNVISFDAPAHSSIDSVLQKSTSSMFEFGKAVSAVANHLEGVYAIVAHSIGSIASVFALTGYKKYVQHAFKSEKFVSISSPFCLQTLITSYCKQNNLTEQEKLILETMLEKEFEFKIADYCLNYAVQNFSGDLLIIHDEEDEDIPISDALDFHATASGSRIYITKGQGHRKVLLNREISKVIADFLKH